MTDKELFVECVSRLSHLGITLEGTCVYSGHGKSCEFNYDGFNLGYNLARLGRVLDEKADFS